MKPNSLWKKSVLLLFPVFVAGSLAAQNPYTDQEYPGYWPTWHTNFSPTAIYPDYPSAQNRPEKPGWDLVFSDEFNGTSVDAVKWQVENFQLGAAYLKPANVTESGGYLNIQSHYIAAGETNGTPAVITNYTSGGIRSNGMSALFGPGKYFEIRYRFPYGTNFHPGFFEFTVDPPPSNQWNEVDFLENGFMGYHDCWKAGGGNIKAIPSTGTCTAPYTHSLPLSPSAPYCANDNVHSVLISESGNPGMNVHDYTIGVDWQGDHIYTYLNNKLIRVIYADANHLIPSTALGELYLWLGINNDASGNVVWTEPYSDPALIFNGVNDVWKIDYIRIYQKRCEVAKTLGVYGPAYGTGDETLYPHLVGDINNDGRADVVVCGNYNTSANPYVANPDRWTMASLGTTSSTFTTPTAVVNDYTTYQGWTNTNVGPRTLADVNGDGKADIVAFGYSTTYVSLSTSTATTPSFAAPYAAISNFSILAGYSDINTYPRIMADVDADGKADIVGFANNSMYVSLSQCSGSTIAFAAPVAVYSNFTTSGGYTNMATMPRMLADMNHDGKLDIVGFGQHGMEVSLSKCLHSTLTVAFTTPVLLSDFGIDQGYTTQEDYPRVLADVNGDGKTDVVGFSANTTNISISSSTASTSLPSTSYLVIMGATTAAKTFFTKNSGGFTTLQDYPRFVSDINCDGKADIIGISDGEVKISLSECVGNTIDFDNYQNSILKDYTGESGQTLEFGNNRFEPRLMADVNGDGKKDLLGFGYFDVKVFSCFSNASCGGARDLADNVTGNEGIAAAEDFSIYPNPNKGDFTVRLPEGMSIVKAEVLNVLGERVLLEEHPAGVEIQLHIGNEVKGIYIVRLLGTDGITYQKKMIID